MRLLVKGFSSSRRLLTVSVTNSLRLRLPCFCSLTKASDPLSRGYLSNCSSDLELHTGVRGGFKLSSTICRRFGLEIFRLGLKPR
jgi:hypothetical protein